MISVKAHDTQANDAKPLDGSSNTSCRIEMSKARLSLTGLTARLDLHTVSGPEQRPTYVLRAMGPLPFRDQHSKYGESATRRCKYVIIWTCQVSFTSHDEVTVFRQITRWLSRTSRAGRIAPLATKVDDGDARDFTPTVTYDDQAAPKGDGAPQ